MRRVSKKRAQKQREIMPQRQAFLLLFPTCWVCGLPSQCVHEIACGMSIRSASMLEDCCWFAACWLCNSVPLTDYSELPLVRQLAMKLKHDPTRVDLPKFNAIRGRAPNAITLTEVRLAFCREYDRG